MALEVQKPDYIHVRVRRGQATDSHSLAERVCWKRSILLIKANHLLKSPELYCVYGLQARREKINNKMKYLQDMVPGCSRILGRAGMLDEIINYVQSLHRQVEVIETYLGLRF